MAVGNCPLCFALSTIDWFFASGPSLTWYLDCQRCRDGKNFDVVKRTLLTSLFCRRCFRHRRSCPLVLLFYCDRWGLRVRATLDLISLSTGTLRWRERQCRQTYAIDILSSPPLLPLPRLKTPIARGCKASGNSKNADHERMQCERKIFKRLLKTLIARECGASGNVIVSAFLLHVGGGSTLIRFCRGRQFLGVLLFRVSSQKI
jgi:hypothetical protein